MTRHPLDPTLVIDKVKLIEGEIIHDSYYQEIEGKIIERLKAFLEDGFTHIKRDRNDEGYLIANYRKENELERKFRLTLQEEHSKLLKERRYQDYLRLKKEFENESSD